MRYQFIGPPLNGTQEATEQYLGQVEKQLRQPRWVRGSLTAVEVDSIASDAPVGSVPDGGGSGQEAGGAPAVQAAAPGLATEQPNSAFPEGDVIHFCEVPERLLGIRWTTHRPSEASGQDNHVQVRARNWTQETWLGGVVSSLEADNPAGFTQDVAIDLEPGDEVGGVYAVIGHGPAYYAGRGTLHLLIARR